MGRLLTLAAPRLPLVWVAKMSAALVLFAVSAVRVVVGSIGKTAKAGSDKTVSTKTAVSFRTLPPLGAHTRTGAVDFCNLVNHFELPYCFGQWDQRERRPVVRKDLMHS